MKNEVVIVGADDWEGLFVNGELVDEGHTLNEGDSRIKYAANLCKQYGIGIDEIQEGYVEDNYDVNVLQETGGFPFYLSEVEYHIRGY